MIKGPGCKIGEESSVFPWPIGVDEPHVFGMGISVKPPAGEQIRTDLVDQLIRVTVVFIRYIAVRLRRNGIQTIVGSIGEVHVEAVVAMHHMPGPEIGDDPLGWPTNHLLS